jgi:uncharacterized repeat protein (TIGR03803 family)
MKGRKAGFFMRQATRLSGGVAFALFALLWATSSAFAGQVLTTLHSFCSGGSGTCPDGQTIFAGLAQGLDGNLYGTTYNGGANGGGTVFKISTTGSLTTLYNFCAVSGCADGESVYAGLTLASSGTFYGVTQGGGANGYGTVFTITTGGALTTLYNFCSLAACADGGYSYGGLLQAANGNFYGTTYVGGGPGTGQAGTMFSITPSGNLTTPYAFCSEGNGATECPDGSDAMGALIQGSDGNFYGTANNGGGNLGWGKGLGNFGIVIKVTPAGTPTTLHIFGTASGFTDGVGPKAGLVQGNDGNFYGTTQFGGANGNYGTVFKITPGGTLTTLYGFCAASGCGDGANPAAPLIQANDGNFYGTTQFGGASGGGTIFRITSTGTLTTLYSFCGQASCSTGQYPFAGLFQATDGNLYGTTYQGGAGGKGTVFRLSLGLAPFVELLPASAEAAATVTILGTKLTGATAVSFNGKAASFQVVSASEITATVPTGATTGTVVVTTPSGTLSGNVPFNVMP